MRCPTCRHRFSFPECLAVWFPSRVPCPACRALSSLGAIGWSAFAAVNLVGIWIVLWVLLEFLQGALALHRAIAAVLLVSMVAPFVWFGTLRLLRARPLRV